MRVWACGERDGAGPGSFLFAAVASPEVAAVSSIPDPGFPCRFASDPEKPGAEHLYDCGWYELVPFRESTTPVLDELRRELGLDPEPEGVV